MQLRQCHFVPKAGAAGVWNYWVDVDGIKAGSVMWVELELIDGNGVIAYHSVLGAGTTENPQLTTPFAPVSPMKWVEPITIRCAATQALLSDDRTWYASWYSPVPLRATDPDPLIPAPGADLKCATTQLSERF